MESQGEIPTSIEEFEKALLKGPNNIEMWIQYMSWVYENQVGISHFELNVHKSLKFRDWSRRES